MVNGSPRYLKGNGTRFAGKGASTSSRSTLVQQIVTTVHFSVFVTIHVAKPKQQRMSFSVLTSVSVGATKIAASSAYRETQRRACRP